MMKIEIYENFGVLGAEKRRKYTYGSEHPHATCSDRLTVLIPDAWELWENQAGQKMVTAPWGWDYEINEVLAGNKRPEFRAMNKDMKLERFVLEVVE